IEQAIGEDVAALEICAQLGFIDCHEGDVETSRHRFDSGHPEAWVWWLDFLFAGDQCNRVLAHAFVDFVVDLARKQPQRQPDHTRGMRKHALNGQMGLAGVGWSQYRSDAGDAGARCPGRLRRKTNGHYASKLVAERWSTLPKASCITGRR